MQPSYWQKYREREYYKIVDGEVKISTALFFSQVLANGGFMCTVGATSKDPKSDLNVNISTPATRRNMQNQIADDRNKRKYYLTYLVNNMLATGFNAFYSMPLSSIYFEEAYENRNNLTKCAGNAFMGTGLATNSLLISAGGANNLTSNQSVKNTLYGVSTAGTAIETFKHAKQAYNLWDTDRSQAWEHVRYAGLFATFGVMPFVLDSYQKKVKQ